MRLVPSVISRAAASLVLLATLTACPSGVSNDISSVQAAVASVAVTAPTTTPVVGQAVQLAAVPHDATGNPLPDRLVSWASSASNVATVSSSGMVAAVAPGSATISAMSEGATGSVALSVSAPATVATVTVNAPMTTMPVGGTTQLTAITRDASGAVITGHAITWSSSGSGVAAVNATGLVTGVGAGSATITATSDGRSGSMTMTVAQVPVASVRINAPTNSLSVGSGTQFSVVVADGAGNVLTGRVVNWSSSDPAVAAVSGSGYVTAASAGTATITATSEGIAGSAVVSVSAPVATVTINAPRTALNTGETVQLSATTRDANGGVITGRTIAWSSSATGVATVNSNGVVTALSTGTTTITATCEGRTGTVVLTITQVPVATVRVTAPVSSVYAGQGTQLAVVVQDAAGNTLTGRVVSWSSSNAAVFTVSASGYATAVTAGTATITATSEGRSGSVALTAALAPVATVRVTPASNSLSLGQGVQLSATLADGAGNVLSGRVVNWSSNNTSVATVSGSGYVTTVAGGSASISATSEGVVGSANVTVTVPVATVTVTAPRTALNEGETTQLSATTRDANGTVLTGRAIAWSSSATAVATVSSTGLVTAVTAGTVNVTATSEGRSGSVAITVTVPPPTTGSNEPSGLTAFSDRHFQALNEAGWTDYKAVNFSLVPDATAPQAQATVGQVLYPAGFAGGTEPVNLYVSLGNRNTVYLAFWFKMSPNFYGHPTSSVNKIFHVWIGGVNRVYLAAMGSGNTATFQPQVRLQQVPATANYNLGPNLVPSASMVRDRWYKWEVVLHANTPGVADGTVEMWLNGVKIGSYTGVQFVAAGQGNTWESLNWAPTWGGAGGTVPADQWMRMSEVYLSGR